MSSNFNLVKLERENIFSWDSVIDLLGYPKGKIDKDISDISQIRPNIFSTKVKRAFYSYHHLNNSVP